MKGKILDTVKFIGLAICIMLGLAAIIGSGGGGGDDGGAGGGNSLKGWVEIDTYSIQQNDPDLGIYAYISGTAFISPDFVAHRCAGLECVFGWYDDSYPGVNVSWRNQADDSTGNAISRYGTLTNWEHEWYAAVPLYMGQNIMSNIIVITATDWDSITGVDSITIQLPPVP